MWSPTHVQVTVQRARGLLTKGKNKTNDCFVTIALGKEKYQTSVKEKASKDVEWREECELAIPEHGNTAEIVLTALHRNFLGVDEFLGMISIPLSSFDVYERPRNRWYTLGSKPGKENTKDRGELEVRIGFIVKAGSLTDLTKKERHKSSLGQLSNAAHSIGGSLLSIGSIEKRKGLKKIAKSIGNRVKGKSSKSKLDKDHLDEREEDHNYRTTRQEPGEADPGVISEDEDEFTFDDLSHKSSASSLNVPVTTTVVNGAKSASATSVTSTVSSSNTHVTSSDNTTLQTLPITVTNGAPSKPPRSAMSLSVTSLSKMDSQKEDEWGLKLYGKQSSSIPKRWESSKTSLRIPTDDSKEEESSPAQTPSPTTRFRDTPEPATPAPREINPPKSKEEKSSSLSREKTQKEEKLKERKEDKSKERKEDKLKEKKEEKMVVINRSPREEKYGKKDKKKDKDNKIVNEDNHFSNERIIIGGEDAVKSSHLSKSRLPHEVLSQFEGKSREDLIELTLQLQAEVADKKKRMNDLEDYIDSLLLRVIECSPRLLQNPFQGQRRLSSPGHQ